MKVHKVTPICKKWEDLEFGNCRPNALTCPSPKIEEKLPDKQVKIFMNDNKNFLMKHNSDSQKSSRLPCFMLYYTPSKQYAMIIDDKTYISAAFLDLSKACDLLSHILIEQLQIWAFGIRFAFCYKPCSKTVKNILKFSLIYSFINKESTKAQILAH